MKRHLLFIDGRWQEGASKRDILSPFDGKKVAEADQASSAQLEAAIASVAAAQPQFAKTSRYARSYLLAAMAREIAANRAEFLELLVREAGKPAAMAEAEINRALVTFTQASEEAKRMGGEVIPLDIDPSGRAYSPAVSYWVPRGSVLAITPFNFPLNLVAHKIAPAFAVGASVLLKPAPQAPGASALLGRIFEKAAAAVSDAREKIPLGALNIVSAANDVVSKAVADPRLSTLSFTGSDKVGWALQQAAIRKKVLLELGGNAALIIHSDADLARASTRAAFGGFAYAGQSCISVQRILVHEPVFTRFTELLVAEAKKTHAGDPAAPETLVGPLIDAAAADRVLSWIEEAKAAGAKVHCGATRQGNVIAPTVMSGVKRSAKLFCEEVFGPVVIVEAYSKFEDALRAVNESRFGLQAGLFTDSSRLIQEALETLEVGGITINEAPTFRADHMPYGGVKDSGLGREGLKYAMEDYCERRTLISWQG